MTAQEKVQLAKLEQITQEQNVQIEKLTFQSEQQTVEIEQLRTDVKSILAVVNEFKGGQKFLKWMIATTIAIGATVAGIINLIRGT